MEMVRLLMGVVLLAAGVALTAMCAGPWSYGFGSLVGVAIAVSGFTLARGEMG